MQIQNQQVRQNILNFLDTLDRKHDSFPEFMIRVIYHQRQTELYDIDYGTEPSYYITPKQYDEYNTMLLHEALNFLKRHSELESLQDRIYGLTSIYLENIGREIPDGIMLMRRIKNALHNNPNLLNEVSEIYRRVAFDFIWFNYDTFSQIIS